MWSTCVNRRATVSYSQWSSSKVRSCGLYHHHKSDKTSSTSSNLLGYAGHPPPQLFRLTRGSGYFCGGGRGRSRLQC
ncbi:hypothetical protein E1A91_A02G113600v1 [Gossypium mustelinum]|nr:hypothetical protein E1A91_A02G113600v1 [Gossypium mustelinum]